MSSPRLVVLLRTYNKWTVERLVDHLPQATDDDEVVKFCGKNGFTLVTSDDMRYTPETLSAMVAYGVGHFKVVSGSANTERKAAAMLVASDRIINVVRLYPNEAFCAHIRLDGHVKVMEETFKAFPVRTEAQQRTEKKYGPVITKKMKLF